MLLERPKKADVQRLCHVSGVARQTDEPNLVLLADGGHFQAHMEGYIIHNQGTWPSTLGLRPWNYNFVDPGKSTYQHITLHEIMRMEEKMKGR